MEPEIQDDRQQYDNVRAQQRLGEGGSDVPGFEQIGEEPDSKGAGTADSR